VKRGTTARGFDIGRRRVGQGEAVYVIAEAGVNHNGDLARARRLVDAAAEAGADAVKFQTFRTEEICTARAPKATYHIETTGSDDQQTWFELLKTQEMDRAMHEVLIEHCAARGITFLSTPYDVPSVELLAELDVPAFKIASTDLNNLPFLRHVASKRRPVILSTAMSTLEEVRESVAALRDAGLSDLLVMHCTGSYPAPLEATNMRAMPTLARELDVLVGYSDHTQEMVNPVLAVALGAAAYEKHFTLDRSLPGPDHRMSLEPAELKRTVELIRGAERALGSPDKAVQPVEEENRLRLRKSLVAACDIPAGTRLTRAHLAFKRPGTGLPPSRLESVVGRVTRVDVRADELLDPSQLG
jgi:N-acetylneuraminate synthase